MARKYRATLVVAPPLARPADVVARFHGRGPGLRGRKATLGCGLRRAQAREMHAAPRMATDKQREAARRNVKKAQAAAKEKRTISKLPKSTRTALGKQGAKERGKGRQSD